MITKSREFSLQIPENIQKNINERGFSLYKWITPDELKLSIEKDFLSILDKIWIPLAVLSIVISLPFIWNIFMMIGVFLLMMVFFSFVILFVLSYFWIKRSFLLVKNAFVLLTDNYISLNWKIEKLDKIWELESDIDKISQTFDENIFQESNIKNTKSNIFKNIKNKFLDWYKKIFKLFWRSSSNNKNSQKLLIVVLWLYSLYLIVISFLYFIWVFFVSLFWSLLSYINRLILLKSWHEVLSINDLFSDIDNYSNDLNKDKTILLADLKKASENDWRDSLLLNINSKIQNISSLSNYAITKSSKLKQKLKDSKYKEMFNFSLYNSWIKKQILEPLVEIYNLLDKNLEILKNTNLLILDQINKANDIKLKFPLLLQQKRLEIKIEEILKHKILIRTYVDRLKGI